VDKDQIYHTSRVISQHSIYFDNFIFQTASGTVRRARRHSRRLVGFSMEAVGNDYLDIGTGKDLAMTLEHLNF